jgi:osmoprotectant transport system permease protein
LTLAQREPLVEWDWVIRHVDDILRQLLQHVELTVIAVVIGFAISFPIGIYAFRHRSFYPPVSWAAGLLYTIPSLALFALLIPFTGLSTTTAEIGLVSYTLLILIRNVVAGLRSVPADVKEAALGMGFSSRQLLWRVELPLAAPVILAGLRIATVTTIGLVTVTALIGKGGLGAFILLGIGRFFSTPLVVGSVLSILFAIVADGLLLGTQKLVLPWAREPRGVV